MPNLIYRENGTTRKTAEARVKNLDSLPTPTYDISIYPALKEKIGIFVTEWSRGCPYQCNFCTHPVKSGIATRNRSAEKIIEELESYKDLYQAHVFRSGDSDTSKSALEAMALRLSDGNNGFEYAATTHMNNISQEYLELMKKSGFYSIFFGMESGSQSMLDYAFNKKLKVETIRRAVGETKKAGIITVTSMIFPSPGETEQTKQESLDLLLEVRPDSVPVNIPIVAPNTAWYREPNKFGIKLPADYDRELMYFTPKLMLPPSQWDHLSFEVNGKNFLELAKESNEFANKLEANGILTQAIDEIMLMAKYYGTDAGTFLTKIRHDLAAGDHIQVREVIKTINSSLMQYK